MKKLFIILLFTSLCLAAKEPAVIDLSKSHNIEDILAAGVKNQAKPPWFHIKEENVILIFPGARRIQFKANRGTVSIKSDGTLTTMNLFTEIMPTDEAAGVMRIFLQSLAQPTRDVDRWLNDIEENRHLRPMTFRHMGAGTKLGGHYPRIQLSSKNSMNPLYLWEFSLFIEWYQGDYPPGWSEIDAEKHNPPAPAGYESISLNPPSGKFYSRSDAYAYAKDWAKKPAAPDSAEATPATGPTQNSNDPKVFPLAIEAQNTVPAWIWWLLGGAVLGGTVFALRRRNK